MKMRKDLKETLIYVGATVGLYLLTALFAILKVELAAGTCFVASAVTLVGIIVNLYQYITDTRKEKKNG